MNDNYTENTEQVILSIQSRIRLADHAYYVDCNPTLSDYEYDQLFGQLKTLESQHPDLITPDSPTQRVSDEKLDGFDNVTHSVPMLSIDNSYSQEDIAGFDKQVHATIQENVGYVVEPKIDGVAVCLIYNDGYLVQAATRGDGRTGDDITQNAKAIRSIPLKLIGTCVGILEIRGEIYWPLDSFNKYNQQLIQAGNQPFANPRNATAGTIKQLDPTVVGKRHLGFIAHSVGQVSELGSQTDIELFEHLKSLGLPINQHRWLCHNIDQIVEVIQKWDRLKLMANCATDGMVIKVNLLSQRNILGQTSRHPKWCLAYKYAPDQAQTRLNSVSFSVGRTGNITPVAHFDSVQLAGTTVSNASLHNFDQVLRLDLRIGDLVTVEKAGEIIPQVMDVDLSQRPDNATPILSPLHCPVCNTPVISREQAVAITCPNPDCHGKLARYIEFFSGRDQMDIEHLGTELVGQLVNSGLVRHIADLYSLTPQQLGQLDRMGEKSIDNVLAAIKASKSKGLARVIGSLGITGIGRRTAEILAQHMTIEHLESKATIESLQEIESIGLKTANVIRQYFDSDYGQNTIARLKASSVSMKQSQSPSTPKTPTPLTNKVVVVTGKLQHWTRRQIQDLIKQHGGKPTSSISGKTDLIITGLDPSSSKVSKATELGITRLEESELAKIISSPDQQNGHTKTSDDKNSNGQGTLF